MLVMNRALQTKETWVLDSFKIWAKIVKEQEALISLSLNGAGLLLNG